MTVLQRKDVVTALHAQAKETAWMECDTMVSTNLQLRSSPASIGLIPGIIAKGVKVMLFAGDEDLICNYKGIERTIASLEWAEARGLGVSFIKPADNECISRKEFLSSHRKRRRRIGMSTRHMQELGRPQGV